MTAPAQPIEQPRRAWLRGGPRFIQSVPLRLSVFLICLLWTIPTLGLLVTSVRDPKNITTSGWWTALLHPFEPNQWTISNYQTVIASDGMGNAFINSLIVTIPSIAIPITIAAFAAYAFAWIPFRGRGILFTIVVGAAGGADPDVADPDPADLQRREPVRLVPRHLAGAHRLRPAARDLPALQLHVQLPRDLFESAAIDGATHLQTFMRLVLPLSIPALGAIAIFQFLWVWNDLLVALVFLGPAPTSASCPRPCTA